MLNRAEVAQAMKACRDRDRLERTYMTSSDDEGIPSHVTPIAVSVIGQKENIVDIVVVYIDKAEKKMCDHGIAIRMSTIGKLSFLGIYMAIHDAEGNLLDSRFANDTDIDNVTELVCGFIEKHIHNFKDMLQ